MEITKRGKTKNEQVWIGDCRQCNSEAKAFEAEMTHITHDYREGGAFSWEKCPVCKCGSESGYGGMLFRPEKQYS